MSFSMRYTEELSVGQMSFHNPLFAAPFLLIFFEYIFTYALIIFTYFNIDYTIVFIPQQKLYTLHSQEEEEAITNNPIPFSQLPHHLIMEEISSPLSSCRANSPPSSKKEQSLISQNDENYSIIDDATSAFLTSFKSSKIQIPSLLLHVLCLFTVYLPFHIL